jgi:hypothetical protein
MITRIHQNIDFPKIHFTRQQQGGNTVGYLRPIIQMAVDSIFNEKGTLSPKRKKVKVL